jgi:predicted HD superfamily hydrolase involved in NAD metabolism
VSRSPELLGRARELLAERVSPSLRAHCERVAETAIVLARRFGVDESDAELAGLMHDIARGEDDTTVLALAEKMGVPVTEYEREHPHVLHARVGAAIVRLELPGIGEAVLSAIEVHTVGALPMSDLDRVVYLADMVEPGRTFEGVDDLRAACATLPLSECFRLGYGRSVRHVLASGRPVHPISAAVGAEIERETGRALFDPPAEVS